MVHLPVTRKVNPGSVSYAEHVTYLTFAFADICSVRFGGRWRRVSTFQMAKPTSMWSTKTHHPECCQVLMCKQRYLHVRGIRLLVGTGFFLAGNFPTWKKTRHVSKHKKVLFLRECFCGRHFISTAQLFLVVGGHQFKRLLLLLGQQGSGSSWAGKERGKRGCE